MTNNKFDKLIETSEVVNALQKSLPKNINYEDIVFLCIGTDRSTGDALGPLLGTALEKLGYDNVIGTVHYPAHALNLQARLDSIPSHKFIIAVDACLGKREYISTISIHDGPLRPGAAVNKNLPTCGDISIKGIVNLGGFQEYTVLQNTRLSVVINLVDIIAESIAMVIPNQYGLSRIAASN